MSDATGIQTRAEQVNLAGDHRYRILVESSPDCIHEVDRDGNLLSMNPAGIKMLGLNDEREIIGASYLAFVSPADRDRVNTLLQQGLQGRSSQFEFASVQGRIYKSSFVPILDAEGRVARLMGLTFDVTEQRNSEDALRRSEEQLRLALHVGRMGTFDWKVPAGETRYSDEQAMLFGFAAETVDFPCRVLEERIHPEDRERVKQVVDQCMKERTDYQNEYRIIGPQGEPRWVEVRGRFLYENDRAVRMTGIVIDVTQRKHAEHELRESEERQRLLLEGVRVIFWEADPKTFSFTYVTGQALALTGYAPEQWYAPDFWVDHLHPEDRDEAVRHCIAAVRRGEPHELEYRMRKADGRWIWLRDIVSVLSGPKGVKLLRGVLVDITDRKQAQEQARQHQAELAHVARLSTAGEMASGLAHELNQPLTAVINFAQGALRRLRSDAIVHQDVLEAIETASAQAHRAAEIIRRLTTFVQKREPRRSSCDINEAVREIVKFAVADAREQAVTIQLDLAADLPLVVADTIQVQQVILNLVRNGIEAMADVESRKPTLEIRTSSLDNAVEVVVCDNGSGLSPEARERIFTPFFTTKPQGMGMGLSISRSIIDAHGGRLWATPNPDGGTTFQFTLPLSDPLASPLTNEPPLSPLSKGGGRGVGEFG